MSQAGRPSQRAQANGKKTSRSQPIFTREQMARTNAEAFQMGVALVLHVLAGDSLHETWLQGLDVFGIKLPGSDDIDTWVDESLAALAEYRVKYKLPRINLEAEDGIG